MAPFNFNIGSSVLKRETRPVNDVVKQFVSSGWQQTGSVGNRIFYLENDGINLTIMKGPLATLVFPSGPVRGRVFGNSGFMAGKKSVLGTGQVSGETGRQQRQAKQMANSYV